MCMEIELIGGAVDGRRLRVCGNAEDPRTYLLVAEHTPLTLDANGEPPTVEALLASFQVVRYDRDPKPCPGDNGPRWLYRRKPESAA